MAYDLALAERLRDVFFSIGPVREVRMFGGVAFMFQGHMCVCVRDEEIYVRLGQDGVVQAVASGEAQPFKPTRNATAIGLATVTDAASLDDGDLQDWVERAAAFVRTLPPKAIDE